MEVNGGFRWRLIGEPKSLTGQSLMRKHSPRARRSGVSPLESDGFSEYRDQEFMDRLEVRTASRALSDFWPPGGPRWDALAITGGGRRLLVEAKANIREFNSDPSSITTTVYLAG